MDLLDRSEDEEEQRSHYGGASGSSSSFSGSRGSRFGARRLKPRSKSHHQLLLMDSVGNGNGDCRAPEEEEAEIVPLPEYERLSQSARLPDDPDPKNPLLPPPAARKGASPRQQQQQQQQKPAAWRLIEYVRSRHRSGSSDGDSRSSDGEKEKDDGGEECGQEASNDKKTTTTKKKKKRSSWLPDPDRRWPVQGFY